MNIHPTAIIADQARLHNTVTVGPYSIIEDDVSIDEGCKISSCVRIFSGTRIGKYNQVDHGAVLGCVPQDFSFDPDQTTTLEIGDHNIFREGANIHRSVTPDSATKIGNNNYFMGTFHVGHNCILGDHNTLGHGTVLAGHVNIGNHIFISGVAAIHQFCRIGDFVMVAGCAKIVKDVPPYTTVDGNPATLIGLNSIALKRAKVNPSIRSEIKNTYKTIYHCGLNTRQALAELKRQPASPAINKIIQFYEASQRGVTAHR